MHSFVGGLASDERVSSNNEKVLLTFKMLSFSAKNLISFFILKENMNRDEKFFSCSEMKLKFWP